MNGNQQARRDTRMVRRIARKSLVLLVVSCAWPRVPVASAQTPSRLQQMAGTWSVEQRMWPDAGAEPVVLPAATAERRIIDGKYLEESMRPSAPPAAPSDAFVRNALVNYNEVEKRFEYVSIDTRAPQVMNERSDRTDAGGASDDVSLPGGTFVAPEWGKRKNVRFHYRLMLGAVRGGKQTVQLYLTPAPASGPRGKEFLAFEYKYTRLP